MRNPKLAVAVIRASTDTQHNTADVQNAAIGAWASRHGITVAETVYEMDVSGALPLEDRKGLLHALSLLELHNAGFLLFADRSRISRDTLVAALVTRECRRKGARLRTADGTSGGTGEADPQQDLITGILDAVSQFERTLIAKRTRAALAAKKARGERTGGIPYGKQLAANNTDLIPNPAEQAVITAAKRLRAEGLSQRGIAARLSELGLHPRTGKAWGKTQIVRMLQA